MIQTIDLSRFIQAHRRDYQTALAEIRRGHKRTHWMWYIFPQIQGLGRSSPSRVYAIRSLDEARALSLALQNDLNIIVLVEEGAAYQGGLG